MKTLQIFNTLSGKKEVFEPIDNNHIKIYACGPTVYNYAHIGNARMAVVFDTFVRTLRTVYPKITYVSNITDIDDKIIEAAKESNTEITAITDKFTKIYNDDMAMLNVIKPDVQPKATEYIPEMIELIINLIDKGFAYEEKGHVLFHVPTYSNYGKLSKRNRDEQIAGSRIEVAPYKKDPSDFVLWKPSTSDQPGWESPWGFGRPGWHTECSAMSEKTLGLPFDIHGGGRDLIFPHHENEIAQSCCSTANEHEPDSYAKYWMHNGFVTINGEKMSKSLGNIILVKDLIKDHHGEVIRLALLSSHYRQGLDWNDKIIHQAKKLVSKIYQILDDLKDIKIENVTLDNSSISIIFDDFNTPGLIAELNKIAKKYSSDDKDNKQIIKSKLTLIGSVLGLFQDKAFNEISVDVKSKIDDLINKRDLAKKEKNFDLADDIRNELNEMGIEIKDTNDGTSWNVK
ncbi:MAG: cysteine--tRNA ligase [SAR86 cluster bacterium]|mgnify:FL=1|jgi:cysteinyl-tRNA synthetase|uniref:Cysteine--tRNA ligase n=1 Tax=SAR86 cluster bacterium TaxID=2030880 RepID=A0A520MXV5_9GAMM|nr:MAG: cysteine--tRNA ligase [SAR86 cluster bacterium]|tara:strand:+ start:9110 stop:10480 length:1371 start_codon:yes stop_codon:yes gene_type:complete